MTAVPDPSGSPRPTTASPVSLTVMPAGAAAVSLVGVPPGSRLVVVCSLVDGAGPTVGLLSSVQAASRTATSTANRTRRIAATLVTPPACRPGPADQLALQP